MPYKAFISYSHEADGMLAPALQHGLHRFNKPWYRRRALNIFRDQTNLAVAPGLWPEIVKALQDSESLLLLASPQAADSKWIDREIEWWLENRGPETLRIVLTDGTLVWDDALNGFSPEHSSSLSPRLARAFADEPLWSDLRWARQESLLSMHDARFREAVAEIAAALQGVTKDQLIGEDLRQHRLTRRAVQAVIVLLAGLAGAALYQASVAERQRDVAERRLVDLLYVPAGLEALQADDWSAALLWFAEALQVDAGDAAREAVHRSRIQAILAAHPQLVDVRLHPDRVVQVQIEACARALSASRDGTVQIGPLVSPQVTTIQAGRGLRKAELGAGGARLLTLVSAGFDAGASDARLWDTATGGQIGWRTSGNEDAFEVLQVTDAVLRDQVLTFRAPQLEAWSASDGGQIAGYDDWHGAAPFSGRLASSRTGRLAAVLGNSGGWSGGNGRLQIWDIAAKKLVTEQPQGSQAAFDADDRWFAVGQQDGSITLWDMHTVKRVDQPLFYWNDGATARLPMRLGEAVDFLAFYDNDRPALLSASTAGSLRAWNLIDGSPLSAHRSHPGGINALALGPLPWRAASAGRDDSVRLWRLDQGDAGLPLLRHGSWYEHEDWGGPDGALAVAFSADGRYLLSGGADGLARLWRFGSSNPREARTAVPEALWKGANALIDGRGGSAGAGDGAEPLRLDELAPGKAFRGLSNSADGRIVAATDRAGRVDIWDRSQKRQLAAGLGPVENRVIAADWLLGGKRIAIADANAASIWDLETDRQIGATMRHRGMSRLLASPDGARLVTIGNNGFRLWDAAGGEPLTDLRRTADEILFVRFSEDNRWLLVAGRKQGQLFEVRTGQPIALPVSWGALADDVTLRTGTQTLQILERSRGGSIRVWDFSPASHPLEQMRRLGQLLSSRRIDESRSIVPLTRVEFEAAWLEARQQGGLYLQADSQGDAGGARAGLECP